MPHQSDFESIGLSNLNATNNERRKKDIPCKQKMCSDLNKTWININHNQFDREESTEIGENEWKGGESFGVLVQHFLHG